MLPFLTILNGDVYLYVAIGGTALFVIKMLLFMLGADHGGHTGDSHDFGSAGHHDLGHADGGDSDQSDHADSTGTFNVFTIQGFLAFLMGFGWMGVAASEQGISTLVLPRASRRAARSASSICW